MSCVLENIYVLIFGPYQKLLARSSGFFPRLQKISVAEEISLLRRIFQLLTNSLLNLARHQNNFFLLAIFYSPN
jgi:hypothetical protein